MNNDFDKRQADAANRVGQGSAAMREGESWQNFLAQFRLRNIIDAGPDRWTIQSTSGTEYTVHRATRMDELGCYYQSWRCDCPARKRCRHIDAVESMLSAELVAMEDYDALNELIG